MKSNDWYIAIDQASYNLGFAALHNGIVYCGLLSFKSSGKHKLPILERLLQIEQFIEEICTAVSPTKVYTEQVHTGQMRAYSVLIKVETTIHNYLYKHKICFDSISANVRVNESWPKLLELSGTKYEVLKVIQEDAPSNLSEHELDAIGILFGSLIRDNIVSLDYIRSAQIVRSSRSQDYPQVLKQNSVLFQA